MHITVQTDYALRVLMYLQDRPNQRSQTQEISTFFNISKNHLVKVVNQLTNLGYIESVRGRYHGGIFLKVDPATVNIGALFLKLETNMALVECFSPPKNKCHITPQCGLIKIFSEARKGFIQSLEKYTLADLKNSTLMPPINH